MALPEVQEKPYSAEDLWELSHRPENDGKRFELSEGALIEMSPAGGKHGGIALDLGSLVRSHVKAHHLGYVTAVETGYILFKNPDGKDTVRAQMSVLWRLLACRVVCQMGTFPLHPI